MVASLSKETDYIIRCLKEDRPTKIQTDSFTLDGPPAIGGTAVWGANTGHPVTCTIVPTLEGHRVRITYRKTLFNGVQRTASALLSSRASEALKRQILSAIALEHSQTIFIFKHEWNALRVDQQDAIGRIVEEVDARYAVRMGWPRKKLSMLQGNPDVPDFFA